MVSAAPNTIHFHRKHHKAVMSGEKVTTVRWNEDVPVGAAVFIFVTGGTFDLLAWNTAAAELFRGALDIGEHPNLVRWVFLAPDAREVLPDWTDVAQGLLARLRARAGRHPGVAAYTELEDDLRSASPEADRWWPRYDVGTEGGGIKRVRLADGRVQRLAYTSFDVSDRPEQTMTTYRQL